MVAGTNHGGGIEEGSPWLLGEWWAAGNALEVDGRGGGRLWKEVVVARMVMVVASEKTEVTDSVNINSADNDDGEDEDN